MGRWQNFSRSRFEVEYIEGILDVADRIRILLTLQKRTGGQESEKLSSIQLRHGSRVYKEDSTPSSWT